MARVSAAAVAVLMLLAGCTITRVEEPSASSDPTFVPATQAEVLQARKAAGIAACPESSETVAARPDGLPDLTLDCLGGDSTVRLAGLRGKPMVINLWAQWCDPCRQEAPYLRRFADEAAGKVDVMGIDITDPLPDKAIEFAAASGWRYPHLVDREGLLSRSMQVPGIPVTLLVNAEGRIVYRHTGPFTSAQQVRDLVSEQLGVV